MEISPDSYSQLTFDMLVGEGLCKINRCPDFKFTVQVDFLIAQYVVTWILKHRDVCQDAYEYNQRWFDGQIGLLFHETPIMASDILHFPQQHGCLSVCVNY